MPPLDQLRYTQRFVDELPGDPETRNYTRAVHAACYSRCLPTPVSRPELLLLVPEVAALLDLDQLDGTAPLDANGAAGFLAEVLGGNRLAPGMAPYAACYGGHQFGSWAGQLGDGRAITLGEVRNQRGETWEVQLKGAGPTPYSRRADGRAVLRSSLRELVCSEAMHHLGVPTTRALSLVTTGDAVVRDMLYDGNPQAEPGAIVCRVAPSFLRFGSYEIHAARGDLATLRRLVAFTIDTLYPSLRTGDSLDVAGLLAEVARRTAHLMVEWLRVGFVHGVMNTDNMSMLGLTIDYGPYGWIDAFDPDWTPNTTDAGGRRYRFGFQPRVAHWNLLQLARALLPLVDDDAGLVAALELYRDELERGQRAMQRRKLGLAEELAAVDPDEDERLVEGLHALLVSREIDMTLFYRGLAEVAARDDLATARRRLLDAYYDPSLSADDEARLASWLARYQARLLRSPISDADRRAQMNRVNPLYVPRNYLLQTVIDQVAAGDRQALPELLDVLRRPYDLQPGREAYAAKRPDWARHKVGCSMLSCSS